MSGCARTTATAPVHRRSTPNRLSVCLSSSRHLRFKDTASACNTNASYLRDRTLDYRLIKTAEGWKIFDVNVLGVWLTLNYRNSFAAEIRRSGIDGLIERLAQKNRSNEVR